MLLKHGLRAAKGRKHCLQVESYRLTTKLVWSGPFDDRGQGRWPTMKRLGYDHCRGVRNTPLLSGYGQRKRTSGESESSTSCGNRYQVAFSDGSQANTRIEPGSFTSALLESFHLGATPCTASILSCPGFSREQRAKQTSRKLNGGNECRRDCTSRGSQRQRIMLLRVAVTSPRNALGTHHVSKFRA